MDRRGFLGTVGWLVAPVVARVAGAQPARNVYRVGYLSTGPSASNLFVEPFREGLRVHGWTEGQNIVIEYRFAEGRFDRLPALAAELVRLEVDVIVAAPTPPAVAAKNATATIPIVMVGAGDPVGLELVASLAHPGANVTGLAFSVGFDTVVKALELLREAVPRASRMAVLSNPTNPGNVRAVTELRSAGRCLGVQLQLLEARAPREFDGAFAAMVKERAASLLLVSDSMFVLHRARLADLAAQHRLPAMYGARENVEAGERLGSSPARGHVRGSDPQGREARRATHRAAHQVRARHQPQDREGARAEDPAGSAGPGRPRDRVSPQPEETPA